MSNHVRSMGAHAVLVDTGDPVGLARAVALAWESGRLAGIVDIVPAARTVLIRFAAASPIDAGAIAALTPLPMMATTTPPVVEVPTVYDGEDLHDVASWSGRTVDDVIDLHSRATYVVDFCGFAPGFGYLSGVHEALHMPRMESPRSRVPAGSVALAAGYTAIYPTSSPGGWRLIGRTNARMFDAQREPAALLAPGATVRFTPVDSLPPEAAVRERAIPTGLPVWEVLQAGPSTVIQDLGRFGNGAIAVGTSGAFDRAALRLANRLVGNAEGRAALEVLGGGLTLRALRPTTIALVGPMARATLDGMEISDGSPVAVVAGQTLQILSPTGGLRTTIAIRGGIAGVPILGSLSRDSLARLGPDPLDVGDLLYAGADDGPIHVDHVPIAPVGAEIVLPTHPGPRADWFTEEAVELLMTRPFTVSARSDRIGVRLEGPVLDRTREARGRELSPEGMVRGAVQVPPDGQPVILGPDHPVTGGYPVIAVVTESAVDLLAQAAPGTKVWFVPAR